MNAAQWLADTETALVLALEACRDARVDAASEVGADGLRGDLTVALTILDHQIGVARGTTRAAMKAEWIGTPGHGA